MTTWTKSVFSSMVQEVGYDADREALIITWKNGSQGEYSGVPEDVAFGLSQAASVGQTILNEIKPVYAYRRL